MGWAQALQAWGCPVTVPSRSLAAAGGPACFTGGSHGQVGSRMHFAKQARLSHRHMCDWRLCRNNQTWHTCSEVRGR